MAERRRGPRRVLRRERHAPLEPGAPSRSGRLPRGGRRREPAERRGRGHRRRRRLARRLRSADRRHGRCADPALPALIMAAPPGAPSVEERRPPHADRRQLWRVFSLPASMQGVLFRPVGDGRLAPLDGLRGLACLGMLLSHVCW
ncbi:MAG: hypothetical protein ACK55I_37815, partial [bacterium]